MMGALWLAATIWAHKTGRETFGYGFCAFLFSMIELIVVANLLLS